MTPQEHLTALVGHPERALDVPPEAPGILIELAGIQSAIAARVASGAPLGAPDAPTEPDRLLAVEEAARLLSVSPDFLYSSPAVKPLRVRIGGCVRFSHRRIQAYISRHAGQD
jgi:predicted DNA-binding transcriptional regulator AlpA